MRDATIEVGNLTAHRSPDTAELSARNRSKSSAVFCFGSNAEFLQRVGPAPQEVPSRNPALYCHKAALRPDYRCPARGFRAGPAPARIIGIRCAQPCSGGQQCRVSGRGKSNVDR